MSKVPHFVRVLTYQRFASSSSRFFFNKAHASTEAWSTYKQVKYKSTNIATVQQQWWTYDIVAYVTHQAYAMTRYIWFDWMFYDHFSARSLLAKLGRWGWWWAWWGWLERKARRLWQDTIYSVDTQVSSAILAPLSNSHCSSFLTKF